MVEQKKVSGKAKLNPGHSLVCDTVIIDGKEQDQWYPEGDKCLFCSNECDITHLPKAVGNFEGRRVFRLPQDVPAICEFLPNADTYRMNTEKPEISTNLTKK